MKTMYGVFAILGLLLPYAQFMPWLADHGFNLPLVWQLATDSAISAFAWIDVGITAIVVPVFLWLRESQSIEGS